MPPGGKGPTFTQWQKLTPYQTGDPAAPTVMPPLMPFYRNILDRRLAAGDRDGFNDVEDFPDGYLGTITDRREARKYSRGTERSYQRGVHKGSAVDPSDYDWPPGMDPLAGIRAEARGLRHAPRSGPGVQPFVGAHLVDGGKWLPRGAEGILRPEQVDPSRRANMVPLVPPWR